MRTEESRLSESRIRTDTKYRTDSAYREKVEQSKGAKSDTDRKLEAVKDRQEWSEEIRQQLKKTAFKKKKVSYDAVSDLMLLMSLEKPGQVKKFCARLKQKAGSIKRNGGEEAEIRAAVTRIKKVLKKAAVKIECLEEEEQLQAKALQAEKKRALKEAAEITLDLNRKRMNRKVREKNDIAEAIRERSMPESRKEQETGLPGPMGMQSESVPVSIPMSVSAPVSASAGSPGVLFSAEF